MMNWAAIIWLGLMAACLAVEAATVTLVSLWFAAGALAAMVAALAGGTPALQTTVFLVVSIGMLMALRPFARKYLTPKLTATNLDALIGAAGIVTGAIDNVSASGQVKLNGMEWSARSTSGQPIREGTRIKVDRIEGAKVYVSPAEIPATA